MITAEFLNSPVHLGGCLSQGDAGKFVCGSGGPQLPWPPLQPSTAWAAHEEQSRSGGRGTAAALVPWGDGPTMGGWPLPGVGLVATALPAACY